MPFHFENKRVVVAGGSRGIGRAIALGFAAAGADVSICARGAAALEATRAELAATGRRVHTAVCDLADGPAVTRYVTDAGEALGGIDVLVNNASGFGMGDDEAGWSAGLSVDVMATVRASHAALPLLAASQGASIINVASISGFRPSTRAPAYGAVKAVVMHYTASQAAALARQGHPRELHRPRIDRISGRALGVAAIGQGSALRTDPREDSVRPHGHSGRSGGGRAVPCVQARPLDHRADPGGRRRSVVGSLNRARSGHAAGIDKVRWFSEATRSSRSTPKEPCQPIRSTEPGWPDWRSSRSFPQDRCPGLHEPLSRHLKRGSAHEA